MHMCIWKWCFIIKLGLMFIIKTEDTQHNKNKKRVYKVKVCQLLWQSEIEKRCIRGEEDLLFIVQ